MSVPQQSPPVLGLAVDPKRALNLLGHADDSILHAKDCRARRCQTVMGPEWSLGQLPEQRLTLVRLSETAAHRGHQRRRRGLTARLLILQGAAERRPLAGKGSLWERKLWSPWQPATGCCEEDHAPCDAPNLGRTRRIGRTIRARGWTVFETPSTRSVSLTPSTPSGASSVLRGSPEGAPPRSGRSSLPSPSC